MTDHVLWDIHLSWNFWFSLGIHIDHRHLYITIHLPVMIVTVGRVGDTGGWSLRRGNMGNPKSTLEAIDDNGTVYTAEIENPRGGMPVDMLASSLVWKDEFHRRFREIDGVMVDVTAAKDLH